MFMHSTGNLGDRTCRMLCCGEVASVWIEWPVSDGRVSGSYCVDHAIEIGLSVTRSVVFLRLVPGPLDAVPSRGVRSLVSR